MDAAAAHLPSVAPPHSSPQAGPPPTGAGWREGPVTRPEPESAQAVAPPQPAEERAEILNLRLRRSTILEINRLARERGMTMKQIVTHAIRDAGANVAPRDLEDHTARRRGG